MDVGELEWVQVADGANGLVGLSLTEACYPLPHLTSYFKGATGNYVISTSPRGGLVCTAAYILTLGKTGIASVPGTCHDKRLTSLVLESQTERDSTPSTALRPALKDALKQRVRIYLPIATSEGAIKRKQDTTPVSTSRSRGSYISRFPIKISCPASQVAVLTRIQHLQPTQRLYSSPLSIILHGRERRAQIQTPPLSSPVPAARARLDPSLGHLCRGARTCS
jgi:hypothetical protein